MKPDILFSIVIPTYNRDDLMLETINSVLDQTYRNFEIIVVDNCSTDNTVEVVQPLVNSGKIIFLRNEKNFERAYSRNRGMAHAKGDFLTLLDSDDFLYPNCLQDACEFVCSHPEIKVFQNRSEVVNDQRQKVADFHAPSLRNQYKELCSGNFMSAIGNFIHRDIYTSMKLNDDPHLTGSEDYEYWFRVLARHKVGRIDKVNSGIRNHPNRSVHQGVFDNLDYQCEQMVRSIKTDPLVNEKFGKYINRLKASFTLMKVIHGYNIFPLKKKLSLLKEAVKKDNSIIFTSRFQKVLINSFLKK